MGEEPIARGRDADIFAAGPGLVRRTMRDGRSQAGEARLLAYLAERGYPVPAVHGLSEDGRHLTLERVEGPDLLAYATRSPWHLARAARLLADLHRHLHAVPAAEFLGPSPLGAGDCVVHLDLHPLNVLVGPRGPVVIDWANAAAGKAGQDEAVAWMLLATADLPASGVARARSRALRAVFSALFLVGAQRRGARAHLAGVAAWRAQDVHMRPEEIAAMAEFARRHGGRVV